MPLAVGDLDGIETSVDIFPGSAGYVETLKSWGERTATTLDRMASVTAEGGTPMAEALEESGPDLLCQSTDRKILVVITDGDPFGGPAASAKIVRRLQQAGVEVVGVGIGRHCKDLAAIFPDNVKIANVGQLTEALAKIFEQRMLDQKCA
jgi:nitric oxide reductase activation protein